MFTDFSDETLKNIGMRKAANLQKLANGRGRYFMKLDDNRVPLKMAFERFMSAKMAEANYSRRDGRDWKCDEDGLPSSESKRHEIRRDKLVEKSNQKLLLSNQPEADAVDIIMSHLVEDHERNLLAEGFMDPFDLELVELQESEELRLQNFDWEFHYSDAQLVVDIYNRCTWWSNRAKMEVCTCEQCKEACAEADQHTAREATRKWVEAKLAKQSAKLTKIKVPEHESVDHVHSETPGADAWY